MVAMISCLRMKGYLFNTSSPCWSHAPKDIADHCHYSVTYFSKIFHKYTGRNFIDYLTFKRIANAKRLLISEPNCKIEYIAY